MPTVQQVTVIIRETLGYLAQAILSAGPLYYGSVSPVGQAFKMVFLGILNGQQPQQQQLHLQHQQQQQQQQQRQQPPPPPRQQPQPHQQLPLPYPPPQHAANQYLYPAYQIQPPRNMDV